MHTTQKIEALLLQYLKEGKNIDDFIISPIGIYNRSLNQEVANISPIKNPVEKTYTGKSKIEVHREGLYDALPEGVFHDIVQSEEDIEQRISEKREAEARQFFLPFEQEFYRVRLRIEQFERALIDGHKTYFDTQKYSSLWSINPDLSFDEQYKLTQILPLIPHIVGDLELTEECFQLLLGLSVELMQLPPKSSSIKHSLGGILGKTNLGSNSILGTNHYDGNTLLRLTIQDIPSEELANYLQKGKHTTFLQTICSYLIPIDTDLEIQFSIKEKNDKAKLASINNRLGYSYKIS